MAKAVLTRLVIASVLLVPGWFLMPQMSSSGGTPPPGSRGAQAAELTSNAALVQAGRVLSDHYATAGTFLGTDLSTVPGTRLVRADKATFCVETGEQSWLYHLESSAQQDNSMNWGAVKGPCPS
jgi:hypothetical protein